MNFGLDMRNLESRVKRGSFEDQKKINLALIDYIKQLHDSQKRQSELLGDILKHDAEVIASTQEYVAVINELMLRIDKLEDKNNEHNESA